MRKNKLLHILALGLVCAAVAVSCGGTAQQNTHRHKVAVVVKSTRSEFFQSAFAGAQAAATEYNLELSIRAPLTEEDWETQNQLVEEAVEQGAEAIVFSAVDYEKNVPPIEAALRAGVCVAAIDSSVNCEGISTYIGTDNYAAGRMAAQAVLESGLEEYYVGLVNFDGNSFNGRQREQGVREALAEQGIGIVAAKNSFATAGNANRTTLSMLAEYPQINVIIAFNEPTTVGAARAVSTLEKEEEILLVGFDSNVETVDKLQTGAVDALVVQNPYAMGYLGVESAARLLNGLPLQTEEKVDTSTVVVTRENMFSPEGQKMLFPFDSSVSREG